MNAASLKRAHEEVLERLKKEASSLARLRHPSILELAEPVEETRNGGLMFATEPVTASLAGLLQEKDDQERAGGVGGRSSRYVIEEADGGRRRRDLEIDELEIQKGLIQIGKGLEFLHESAGLVHGNLTPEAIFINAKVGNTNHFTESKPLANGCDSLIGKSPALGFQALQKTQRRQLRWLQFPCPKYSTTTLVCRGLFSSTSTMLLLTSSWTTT